MFMALIRAFKFAFVGMWDTFKTQRNFKIELVIGICALIAAAALQLAALEWAVIIILVGVVLAAEMLNTAMEAAVDLASPEQHPLAKRAKDTAAAMVLVCAMMAAAAGLIIYINAFLRLAG
jgi:diacylglycerol kinase